MNCSILVLLAMLKMLVITTQVDEARAFLQIIEAQTIHDVDFYLEYEGQFKFPVLSDQKINKLADDGIYNSYSGSFRYRNERAAIVDIFHKVAPRNELSRQTLATFGGRSEVFSRNDASGSQGGKIVASHPEQFVFPGSYGRIFLISKLKGLLQDSRNHFTLEPSQMFNKRSCEVVSLVRGEGTLAEVSHYWIDLERGGHPIKMEIYRDGKLSSRTVVRLDAFANPGKEDVWIPVSGICESFRGTTKETADDFYSYPSNVEEMEVVRTTVVFEKSTSDDKFKIKFNRGTFISDQLRGAEYEFGQVTTTQPTTRAQAEANLRALLTSAQEQKTVLDASSSYYDGASWVVGYLPLLFCGMGFIAVSVILVRRFKNGNA